LSLLIYIEDQLIKLSPGTVLAYTYQNTLLTDLTTRHSDYSNSISAPFCPENDLIFGLARLEKSDAEPVYRLLSAKVIRNGYTIPLTVCEVTKTDDAYQLEFYSGIKQFIDEVGDGTIDQLNNIDNTLITWSPTTIDSKRNASSGIVAPVINYGQISREELIDADFTGGGGVGVWEQHNLIPEGGSGQYQDKQYANGGTYIYAELDSYAVDNGSVSVEQPGGSVMLRQKYNFYKGQEYDISLRHNYVGANPAYGRVYLMTEDPNVYQLIIDTANAAATTDTVTVSPNRDYTYIGIFGFLPAPTPTIGGASVSADIRVYLIEIILKLDMTSFQYPPSVYYKNVIQAIYEKAGYQAEQTAIFSDDIHTNAIITFSKKNFEYTGFFNQCREFKAELSEPVTISADGNVIFDTIITKDLFGFYNPTTGDYDTDPASAYEPEATWDTRSFYGKFYAVMEVVLISGTFQFQIRSQGFSALTSQTISTPGRYLINLAAVEFDEDSDGFLIEGGDVVSVYVDMTSAGSVRINKGFWYCTVNGKNHEATNPGFYICELLPPTPQKEVIKDFFVTNGLVPFEKNRLLTLKSINEVIEDRASALDWTTKRDRTFKDGIEFQRAFAQNNYFTYPSNDKFFDPYYTRGNIKVPNQTLEPENTLYQRIFNGSSDVSVNAGGGDSFYIGFIPVLNQNGEKLGLSDTVAYPVEDEEFGEDPGLRLMMVRDRRSGEPNVSYDGNSRNDYLMANFLLPGKTQLAFEIFLERFYSKAYKGIERNKFISRFYRLNDADISQVHPHKLIYDDGSYFWLNQIEEYTGNGLTKVYLFKVS